MLFWAVLGYQPKQAFSFHQETFFPSKNTKLSPKLVMGRLQTSRQVALHAGYYVIAFI